MSELIDDILMLSQVTHSDFRVEDVDLGALCMDIIDELAAADPDRRVEWDINSGLHVRGDRRLLRLVLQNLLGNAWKFTAGTSQARIAVGMVLTPHGNAICVRDNGAGFDMLYATKLFQPFQRLHRASEFEGSGIGLAIVQRVINRHGGRVWAEGTTGEGASFYFVLG